MKTRLLLAALMAWLLWLPSWAQSGFNPDNPGDPGTPKLQYTLTLSVTPAQTGSINYSTGRYTAGEKFTLSAYANSDYRFVAWVSGTDTVSQSSNLTYTMPSHNAALTAVFTYSPGSPADPVTQPFKRQLSLVAEPAGAGSFNMNSGFYDVGSSHTLQAYANTDYTFTNWRVGDSIVGSNSRLDFTMPEQGLRIVGHFDYNPSSPGSPHKNHWNPLTGEVIVTDFTTGWLSDAVSEVIGGSSHRGEVLSITVAGRINDKDFGIANTYTNCSLLDLSRTTGVTAVPSYAFDHTNLESVYLPATVERIGAGAFEDCSQLASVTVYALTPPVLESNVFRNVPDGLVAYVPAGVIALYQEADGWKDLTLLPIQRDIRNLTVQLPTSAVAADYALMQLELTNTKSGQRLHYVMGDKTAYTFNNIIIGTTWNVAVRNARGDVFGQIDDVEVNDEDVTVTFSSLAKPHDVTLKVLAGKGADVSAQVETAWLDAEGNHLATGNTLNGMPAGEQVMCRITLPQRLAMTHHAPPVITHTVTDGDNAVVCRLDTIAALAITGRVTDARTGQPIGGATVSASQTYGGKYDRTVNGTTAADGTFAIAAHRVPTGITVAATDYVSQSLTCDTTAIDAILALGDLTLEAITGATVNISFTYTPCHAGDVEAEVQDWYDDYGNVDYTLRDTTAGRDITQFSVQYPKIVLLEDVADGHVLRLTATSRKGAFAPVNATASLSGQKATATFHLVEPGQIAATFAANDNAAVVGTLYDAEGKLVNTAAYGNEATLTFSNLADGCYTLVTMGKSTLFNTVYDLAQLPVTGLKAGVDYACDTVTVNAGLISAVSIDRVPTLDESKLYYTGDGTSFTSNKTSIVVGNYLTLTGRIDFKPAYATRVSDVQLTVSLPEACSFVENSVMVGNSTATYTLHNGQLTIPLGSRYTDRVRFCVVPTAGGDYAPSALVQFALDDSTMTQPIGAAAYTARDLSISVPSTVAKTTIPVSGTAQAMSQIDIYDADVLIGHTTALANGSWATTCELTDAYNLSQHPIHAVATTKQGLQLNTEQMTCTYDRDAIQVSKVTMIYNNGWNHKEYRVVYDYQKPTGSPSRYDFYSNKDPFTFMIDFTDNDTTKVSDVVLYVKTSDGKWRGLETAFNDKLVSWVAYGTFTSNSLPVNVSVDYNTKVKSVLSAELFDAAINSYNTYRQAFSENVNEIDSLISQLSEEWNNNNYEDILSIKTQLLNISGLSLTSLEPQEYAYVDLVSYLEELENEPNDSISFVASKLFNQTYEEICELSQNIEISSCDSLTIEQLLAEGYEVFEKDDATYVYFLATDSVLKCADFENNLFYVVNIEDEMNEDSQMSLRLFASAHDSFETRMRKLAQQIQNGFDKLRGYLGTFAGLIEDLERKLDFRNGQLANTIDQLDNRIAYLERKLSSTGLTPDEFRALERYRNLYAKRFKEACLNTKLLSWIERINAAEIRAGKIGIKGMKVGRLGGGLFAAFDIFMIVPEMLEDIENVISTYHKIPRPCEGDQAQANLLSNEVVTMGIGAGVYYAAQLVSDAAQIALAITGAAAALPSGGTSLSAVAIALGLAAANIAATIVYERNFDKMLAQVSSEIDKLDCTPEPDPDPEPDPSPEPDSEPSLDPSGYVYEGVASNRLEGVKATCFYKETVEDMYGDPHENIVLWDATEHGQENPLFTDAMGMYRWDVPVGLWQVKFEKAGYETAYSEWLPVPPPQLDVNIAMRQMTQPTVLMAHAFQNAVELEFDKYMMAETLTTDNIIVTQNGTAVSGTVSLLNAESEGDGRYASRVRFNAAKPFEAEQVTLTVSSRVKSYAGLRMDGDFQQTFDVELEVSTIEADSITLVPYGGQRTLTVTVLPAAASAGKTLNVRSSSTVIASVDGESHTIDDHGQVTVTVTGELPGAATLLYSLDGYDLTAATIVNVVSEDQLVCAAPTASVASGSTVDKGTKVELSCSTPNATIYYTLDGSCPCEDSESRLTYDGTPIVIDHSLTIKAMAVAPGLLESDVVELTYKLNGNAVTDLAIDSEVKVFPVPMRDELHVTANGRTLRAVEVYATNGTLATAWRQTGTQATLNVSNLPAGVYVVVVTTSDGTCTRKVIKVV